MPQITADHISRVLNGRPLCTQRDNTMRRKTKENHHSQRHTLNPAEPLGSENEPLPLLPNQARLGEAETQRPAARQRGRRRGPRSTSGRAGARGSSRTKTKAAAVGGSRRSRDETRERRERLFRAGVTQPPAGTWAPSAAWGRGLLRSDVRLRERPPPGPLGGRSAPRGPLELRWRRWRTCGHANHSTTQMSGAGDAGATRSPASRANVGSEVRGSALPHPLPSGSSLARRCGPYPGGLCRGCAAGPSRSAGQCRAASTPARALPPAPHARPTPKVPVLGWCAPSEGLCSVQTPRAKPGKHGCFFVTDVCSPFLHNK